MAYLQRQNILLQLFPQDIVNEIIEYLGPKTEWANNLMHGVIRELIQFQNMYLCDDLFVNVQDRNIKSVILFTQEVSCTSMYGLSRHNYAAVLMEMSEMYNHYVLWHDDNNLCFYYIIKGLTSK
jgi:hypothetical protein